ncbi:tape measure protein [Mycobacterium phage JackSparrow]|nr:tape measure protein [Mycobacterium phage JackSparrow]
MAAGKEVGRLSIKVTPDLDGFYRELKRAIESAEKMKVHIPVEPDMGNFRSEVAAKTKGMSAKVKVDADVDVDKGFFRRISEGISKIPGPSFGSGINPAGYAAIFAGITVLAAPLIGLLTSALLTLPGLISAVAVPIGALALGIDGLKKAAERLQEPFEALKASMSAAVEQQFGPVFDQLGKAFPMLAANLPKVTQGMADFAKSFTDTITSEAGMAKIEGIISNIGAAISRAAPGIGSFTDGLLTLAEKFTSKLPNVADWFNQTGESFRNWINKLNEDGTLDKAFDGLGASLKTLLEGVGGILESGLDFFKDPKNIEDFNEGLKSIGDSLQSIVNLSNTLNGMGDLFKGLLPNFDGSALTDDLFAPFTSEDAGWRDMFAKLQIGWEGVKMKASEVWSSVQTSAATAMSSVAATIATLPSTLSNVWNSITTSVSAVWSQIVAGVSAGARQVLSAVGNAFSSVGSVISNAFSVAVNAVRDAFNQMVSAAVEGASRVLAEIQALPGKIAAAAGNFGSALVAAGKALMDGLLSGIKAGLESVLSFASGIAAKIAAVKGPLPKDRKELIPAGEALMEGLGTGLENGLDPVLDRAKQMAKQIFEAFKETFGTAPGAVAFNLGGGTAALQSSLGDVQTSLQSTLDTSKELNKSFAEPIAGAADGSSLLSDDMKQQIKDVQDRMALLELQRKQLKVQKNEAGSKEDKAAIQDKIDALQAEKDKLAYQKDQLKIQQKQTGQMGEQKTLAQFLGEQFASTWQQGTDAVAGFARANLDQAMSDLGIGGGAITNGLNAGLDWGVQALGNVMNIQVNSVDDAIAVKNNEVAKQALTYTRR